MPKRIYYCEIKYGNKFALEPIISQFLGGAYALDEFKIRKTR